MEGLPSRLARERRTIEAMVTLFCRDRHGRREALCAECQGLMAYADRRVEKCPYGTEKPTCVKCPIHCYTPVMRERVREVMRWAGPRMLRRHPLLAIRHILDGRRKPPERPLRKRSSLASAPTMQVCTVDPVPTGR